jgi:hypothetical protein
MTLKELERAYWNAREKGHQWVQLTIERKTNPRNWDRVRVIPGLYGRVVGPMSETRYLVDVTRDDLGGALFNLQQKAAPQAGEDT